MVSSVAERFWSKVDKSAGPNGCWLWKASCFSTGYGVFSRMGTLELAHRCSWELANGPIPKGLWVCHHCDCPPCVNPEHLFLATSAGNTQDSVDKGRRAKGATHGSHKLTEEDILAIRARYARGGVLKRELADAYGVTPTQTGNIISHKHWKHLK